MIARLVESPEFASLKEHFDGERDAEYGRIARKLFTNPESLDPLYLAEKRGFYKGIEAVLDTPRKLLVEIRQKENA